MILVFLLLQQAIPRRSGVLWFAASTACLLLSHSRTPLVAGGAGFVAGVLAMFVSSERARRLVSWTLFCVPVAALMFGPAVQAWFLRGQDPDMLNTLTGRTKAWAKVYAFPRDIYSNLFGVGLTDKSIEGLSIDSGYLSIYHEQGRVGVAIIVAIFVLYLARILTRRPSMPRAIATFLVVYVLIASYTETGIGDMSSYVLHLMLAMVMVLMPMVKRPARDRRGRGDRRGRRAERRGGGDMRILLVHNFYRSGAPSGENRVVDQDLELLRAVGHTVELHAVSSDEIDGYSKVGKALLPGTVIWSPKAKRDLAAAIARFRPDVVHVHNSFPLLSASILAATNAANVATVATLHNYRLLCAGGSFFRDGAVCHDCLPNRTLPGIRHGCYRDSVAATLPLSIANLVHAKRWKTQVDALLTLSSAQRRLFVDAGFPGDRTFVKPNWVPDRPVRTAADLAPTPEFAYLGRLAAEKGIALLMEAWDLLLSTVVDTEPTLVIAGGGPLEADVQAWAATRPSVRFVGHQDAAGCSRITNRALASLVPSVWEETFGLVVIEAMAAGVPAIAPAHASFPDFIRSGVDGLLVEPAVGPGARRGHGRARGPARAGPVARRRGPAHVRGAVPARGRHRPVDRPVPGRHPAPPRRRPSGPGARVDRPPASDLRCGRARPRRHGADPRHGRHRRPQPLSQRGNAVEREELDVRTVLLAMRRRWRIMLVGVLGGVILAGLVTMLLPKTYATESKVNLGRRPSGANPTEIMRTEAAQANRSQMAQRVIDSLGLDVEPEDMLKQYKATPETDDVLVFNVRGPHGRRGGGARRQVRRGVPGHARRADGRGPAHRELGPRGQAQGDPGPGRRHRRRAARRRAERHPVRRPDPPEDRPDRPAHVAREPHRRRQDRGGPGQEEQLHAAERAHARRARSSRASSST